MNLQQVFNIVWIASLYAIFAIGLNLTMGVARVLNIAHAAIFTWGGVAPLWWTPDSGGDPGGRRPVWVVQRSTRPSSVERRSRL